MKNNGTFLFELKISNTCHQRSKRYSLESEILNFFQVSSSKPPKQVFFSSPKNKKCLRKSFFVISQRTHEEKLLSFHFKCEGFGSSLNNSLCETSYLQFSHTEMAVLMSWKGWLRTLNTGRERARYMMSANQLQSYLVGWRENLGNIFCQFMRWGNETITYTVPLNNTTNTSCIVLKYPISQIRF